MSQMALFEKRCEHIDEIEFTTPTKCIIEASQNINGHTEYILRVESGYNGEKTWKIIRRYNDFLQLQKCLAVSGILLPFPPKKIFGNMRPDFIVQRRQALQLYINAIVMNPILASSLPARRFVDPDSYSQSFHDQAVQDTAMCLRSDNQWTLGNTMGPIGWRVQKHYFKVSAKLPDKNSSKLLVKSVSQSHQSRQGASLSAANGNSFDFSQLDGSEMVLEWVKYGSDKIIDDKEISIILKSLKGLQHPYIEPIIYATHNENGVVVIRKLHKHGTLKDHLCTATPKNPFLAKYGNPKRRTVLSLKQVALYGYQILKALIFLHSKGYPYGHLHSGNIIIADDQVKLLDIENFLTGVPAFYRPFFVQHSKIQTIESVDVYSFGHVLFEMTMGYPLQESVVRQINDCPDLLKNLLESILSKEACKTGLPTLEQLLKHKFFSQHVNEKSTNDNIDSIAVFQLSTYAKDCIKQAILKFEQKLRDEQKSVKNQKRIVRVQELMSSEEEKRKVKHKAKLEMKQSKLKQQSSLQAANNGKLSIAGAGSSVSNETCGVPLESTHTSVLDHLECEQRDQRLSYATQYAGESRSNASLDIVERQSSYPNISSATITASDEDDPDVPSRSALLESICKFNRGSLRKVRSND